VPENAGLKMGAAIGKTPWTAKISEDILMTLLYRSPAARSIIAAVTICNSKMLTLFEDEI
jgi:hypothetical protein